jgi:hypothetical protein
LDVDALGGSVGITVFAGGGTPQTTSLGVFRYRKDDVLIAIADGIEDGTTVIDRYPPLDTELVYVIAAYTANGLSSRALYNTSIESLGAVFVNFGDNFEQVARLTLRGDISWGREHVRTEYSPMGGEKYPIVIYTPSESYRGSVSGTIGRFEARYPEGAPTTYKDFEALSSWTGICIWRRPFGEVFPADVTVNFVDGVLHEYMDCSLTFVRGRAHGLVI